MKRARYCIAALAALAVSAGGVQTVPAKLADFAWLAGHWHADFGGQTADEYCSAADKGVLTCMARFDDAHGPTAYEFIAMRESAQGVEEKIRFFGADLQPDTPIEATLQVVSFASGHAVLENPTAGVPKRITMAWTADQLNVHIEIVEEQKEPRAIDAVWQRIGR